MSWKRPDAALWGLPEQVKTDRGTLTIRTDFRLWCEAERLAAAGMLTEVRLLGLLKSAFSEGTAGLKERGEVFLWFLSCGREPERDLLPGQPVLDYRTDRDRIAAAFQREYGVDLFREEVHWWRFRALLEQLLTADDLRTVAGYRCMPLERVPKEERAFFAAKKVLYRLDREPETAEERNSRLAQQLRQAAGKGETYG